MNKYNVNDNVLFASAYNRKSIGIIVNVRSNTFTNVNKTQYSYVIKFNNKIYTRTEGEIYRKIN